MTTFTAVVCTKGRPDVVDGALDAINRCDPAPDEVLVVDGDAERSAEGAAQRHGARYLTNEPGLTRQRNRALDEATSDVVAFFDDDARPTAAVFAHLARAYADAGVVGATGPIIEPGDHRIGGKDSVVRRLLTGRGAPGTFTRGGYPRRYGVLDHDTDVEFAQGAFLTARRALAATVRFDEALPGYGLAEDEDFSRRLSRLGRIRYVADAVVEHLNLGFGGRDARAFNKQLVANRWHLFRKNFDVTLASRCSFAWMVCVLFAHRAVNRDWRGIRGLADGVCSVVTDRRRDVHVQADAPVRVVFVSSHARNGGSERYLETLLDALGDEWRDSVVLLEDGPMRARLAKHGIEPIVVQTGPSPLAIIHSSREVRAHVRRRHAPLVHANGVKAALVAVLAGVPTVWVKHDDSYDGAIGRLIARRCRVVVGVSRATLDGIGAPSNGAVVHTGLDVTPVDVVASRELVDALVGRRRPVVALIGRLDPVKGHVDVLDGGLDAAVLVVGGDDPSFPAYADELRRQHPTAIFTGRRDDVREIAAGSDIVAVPSRTEGFGLVALEAMSVGTPVVGYAVGALPEVVGDAGVLVAPGDAIALRTAIAGLLDDPAHRAALGDAGRARVADRFSGARWVAEMCDHYVRAGGR